MSYNLLNKYTIYILLILALISMGVLKASASCLGNDVDSGSSCYEQKGEVCWGITVSGGYYSTSYGQNKTQSECAAWCDSNSLCKGFVYNSGTKQCGLTPEQCSTTKPQGTSNWFQYQRISTSTTPAEQPPVEESRADCSVSAVNSGSNCYEQQDQVCWGITVSDGYYSTTYGPNLTKEECALWCDKNSQCKGFAYNTATKQCGLTPEQCSTTKPQGTSNWYQYQQVVILTSSTQEDESEEQTVEITNAQVDNSLTGLDISATDVVVPDADGKPIIVKQEDKDNHIAIICSGIEEDSRLRRYNRTLCGTEASKISTLKCYYQAKGLLFKTSATTYVTPCTATTYIKLFADLNVALAFTPDGCTNDSFCSNPTPACDTASGLCVACINNSHCSSGYECTSGQTCNDIDECATNNGNCGDPTFIRCTNNVGALPTCSDIDECITNNGNCGNIAYYTCSNNYGALPTCIDINQCLTNNGNCGNAAYFTCTNNVGTEPSCADIDECATNNGDCGDSTYYSCINNIGADPTCSDIDECATNNGGCGDPVFTTCSNNLGGPATCVDINECATNNGGCDTEPLVQCTNLQPGSICGSCPSGYQDVNGDGTDCQDIDECTLFLDDCGINEYCLNTTGSYTCDCVSGFTKDTTDNNICKECNNGSDPSMVCSGNEICGVNFDCGLCDISHICSGSTPFCNQDTQICVECLQANHCNSLIGEMCGTDNTCAECNDEAGNMTHNCAPGLLCDESQDPNACVECISDSECNGFEQCCLNPGSQEGCSTTNLNTCVGCIDDCNAATPNPKLCDYNSRTCKSCLTNCAGATPVCNYINHTCTGCMIDQDCPLGWYCDCLNKVNDVCVDGGGCTSISCTANWGPLPPDNANCSEQYPYCLDTGTGQKLCHECLMPDTNNDCDYGDGLQRECINNFCVLIENVFEAIDQ